MKMEPKMSSHYISYGYSSDYTTITPFIVLICRNRTVDVLLAVVVSFNLAEKNKKKGRRY